ncbi:RagB/SusD family nutrient uptake outer membrane protein [Dysgonomonas sp. ZJ279]|uniref:RagB/SusD family nutrient uptake outer membrane protein n=1 Tax=Dysgonomonas sp. ZJ279 TaxID=2709796 RepID=UPI0013EB0936|nr:RagB/SusD family nutrient uptake outer membrane protein [Dysgonomonas sp. ZJ279]
MNKNKFLYKIKATVAVALCATVLGACTDNFYDINKNPAEPNEEEIEVGNYKLGAFFSQMQNIVYPVQENAYQMCQNLVSDVYGRYLTITNDGWKTNYAIFNAPLGWLSSPFNDPFDQIYGAWGLIKTAYDEDANRAHYFALAQILRVAAMHRVTDSYGPIPYSKVANGNIVVPYDTQEEVYNAMFTDLNDAIAVLTDFVEKYPDSKPLKEFDQVYGGDYVKWIKYANSMKLRMALRIAYGDPVLAQKMAEEAVSQKYGIILTNSDNAYNVFPKNPYHKVCTEWGDSRVCADIVTYMVGYNDPRLGQYFTTTSPDEKFTGKLEVPKDAFLGLRSGITIPSKSWGMQYSNVTFTNSSKVLWISASELAFAKAEGVLRGWNMGGGTAESLYKEGIVLSFEQWNASGSGDYMNDDTSKPADYTDKSFPAKALSTITIKWKTGADFETNLEQIMTQKWIAMWPLGMESWSEQRRTGYPRFFPVVVNDNADQSLTTKLAARIPYPPSEKENNLTNYNAALQLLGGADNYSTKLWWDKKTNKP